MGFKVTWLQKLNNWLPHRVIGARIRRKQLMALLVIGLIPLMAMGILSYSIAKNNLLNLATEQLAGIRKLKTNIVQDYFSERRKDLEQLADNLSHLYEAGYDQIHALEQKKEKFTEAELTNAIKAAVSPSIQGGTTDMIKHYRKKSGFENIFLVSKSGFVFHAANHGPDRYTNLFSGPLKKTNLARLTSEVFKRKSFGMADFENYMPAQNAPAAFMAQPVIIRGDVKFIVAVQLSIGQINAVAEERTGLGQTGEIYFVGKDKMFRNDSFRMKKQKVMTTILSPEYKVDTEASRSALNGGSGTKVMKNYQGIMTLSSWQPVTIVQHNPVNPNGIKWALITEIEENEIKQPMTTFGLKMAGTMGVVMGSAILLIIISAYLISGSLTRQIKHIMDLFGDIGMGNFDSRCKVISRDELGTMAQSLNAMLDNTTHLIQSVDERDRMQNAIMKLLTDISALTEGDLTVRAEVTEDMTGAIADSFNTMAEHLSRLVNNVKKSTLEVNQTSRQVSKTTIDMARASDEHAAMISGAVQSIEDMSVSIRLVSKHAEKSAEVSEQAKQNALSGADAVRQTNQAMNAIRERVQEAARAIKRLGESSQEIGNIVKIINDIADRTSILALNASIQAAMAGEAGRGFAVVAEEVQRLAEQSGSSTKQIETLVKTIQSEIQEAGTRMNDSIQRVVQGTELADGAHNKLEVIEEVSTELADLVQSISKAAKEQAASSVQISTTMKEVGKISGQAALKGKQTAASIGRLAKTSGQLNESVGAFTIQKETSAAGNEDLEIMLPVDAFEEMADEEKVPQEVD